jgi:hypothetical protein
MMNGIDAMAERMVKMDLNEFRAFMREQLLNSGGPALIASANACLIFSGDDGPSVADVKELVFDLRSQLEGHDFIAQLTSLLMIVLSGHLEEERTNEHYRHLSDITREGVADKIIDGRRPEGPGPMYG